MATAATPVMTHHDRTLTASMMSGGRWTKKLRSHNKSDEDSAFVDSGYYAFTEEDQIEQLQLFVDWLNDQRVSAFSSVRDPQSPTTPCTLEDILSMDDGVA